MRSLQFLRQVLASWLDSRHKPSRPRRRRAGRLVLEALEDRLTPSAGIQEQYMLDLVNRFRANPTAELALILAANDPNVTSALSAFGVDQTTLAAQFAALTPAPPLAWNDDLGSAALAHSQAMLTAQDQDHQVPGEADLATRITNAGYTDYTDLAEDIFAYAASVFEAEAAFVIDWGANPPSGIQDPTGHRDNLLDPDLTEAGIGLVDAPAGSAMGPILVTQDFGNRADLGNPFLLGSVFTDTNNDGFYEPGEGLSGVNVSITGSAGTFQTTTSAAGGYQIQLPAGSYQVVASGGGLTTPVSHTVVVGSVNVEADFINPQVTAPAAPTFTGPTGSTTSTSPTISWTATTGATQYGLWVNDVTTGQAQVIRNQTLTTNSFTPATLLPAGSYQAWIQVTTAGGTSDWSATDSFTITAPAIPAITAPTGSMVSSSPTFTWTASAGATRYDLWVSDETNDQSQIIRQQNLTTNSFTPSTPLPVGSYEAWVQAFDNAGSSAGWSATLSFMIAPPAPPTLTGPATTTSTTPTLTWTASSGASEYDVWANNLTTGQSQIIRQTVTSTFYTPTNPMPRGQYIYWVRAANSAGAFGAWSAGFNFLIDTTAPAIPTIAAPSGSTSNVEPTISWTTTGAARYDLWVNNLTTGQNQIIRQQNLTANSFTPATALPLGSYVAWVEAFDNTNETRGWSTSFNFTITAPAAPTQVGPTGTIMTSTPTFTWAVVANAVSYDLWVNDATTGQSQIIRQQDLTNNSYTPLTALAAGTYVVWVRAFDVSDDASNWSTAVNFTIA